MHSNHRKMTCKVLELAEEGVISWEAVARAALIHMSESEVAELARIEFEIGVDTGEDDPSDDFNYVGSRHHY